MRRYVGRGENLIGGGIARNFITWGLTRYIGGGSARRSIGATLSGFEPNRRISNRFRRCTSRNVSLRRTNPVDSCAGTCPLMFYSRRFAKLFLSPAEWGHPALMELSSYTSYVPRNDDIAALTAAVENPVAASSAIISSARHE